MICTKNYKFKIKNFPLNNFILPYNYQNYPKIIYIFQFNGDINVTDFRIDYSIYSQTILNCNLEIITERTMYEKYDYKMSQEDELKMIMNG